MACNCIKDIETRVLDKTKSENPTWVVREDGFENKALFFGKDAVIKLILPIEIDYRVPKKDGNLSIMRHHKVKMMATYCPFCGVLYEPEQKEETTDGM